MELLFIRIITFCVILILNINFVQCDDLPCVMNHSVNIANGTKYQNESIIHDGLEYTKNNYGILRTNVTVKGVTKIFEQIRGCICNIDHAKPCIPYCCNPGYISFENKCVKSKQEVLLKTGSRKDATEINVTDHYRIVKKAECSTDMINLDNGDVWSILPVSFKLSQIFTEYQRFIIFSIERLLKC